MSSIHQNKLSLDTFQCTFQKPLKYINITESLKEVKNEKVHWKFAGADSWILEPSVCSLEVSLAKVTYSSVRSSHGQRWYFGNVNYKHDELINWSRLSNSCHDFSK